MKHIQDDGDLQIGLHGRMLLSFWTDVARDGKKGRTGTTAITITLDKEKAV